MIKWHELIKHTEIIDTQVGKNRGNINRVGKQGSIFNSVTCYASTSKVNYIIEKVQYNQRNAQIGMSVFMDDTAIIGS